MRPKLLFGKFLVQLHQGKDFLIPEAGAELNTSICELYGPNADQIKLMDLQDQAVLAWVDSGGLNTSTFEEAVESHQRLQEGVNEITRKFPGNIFVLRALRAIPTLREVRLSSRDMVAERLSDAMAKRDPRISRERFAAAARLTTELTYAAMEMVLEEPERDAEHISTEVARMIVKYYAGLQED